MYGTYCAGCHREAGNGDGSVGHLFSPEPRDFTDAVRMSKQTDTYLSRHSLTAKGLSI